MIGTQYYVDLESVLKELKPGAVIRYVGRNGTIQEVIYVGREDWEKLREDSLLAADRSAGYAQGALRRGRALRMWAEGWTHRTEQRFDDLREHGVKRERRTDAMIVELRKEIRELEAKVAWLFGGLVLLLALVIVVGVM